MAGAVSCTCIEVTGRSSAIEAVFQRSLGWGVAEGSFMMTTNTNAGQISMLFFRFFFGGVPARGAMGKSCTVDSWEIELGRCDVDI